MRKIISLGLLALSLSLTATALFAGYPACDDMKEALKEAKIYGWCNAWHDADTQEEKDRIEARILERIVGIDIKLPWLDDEGGFTCPCWTAQEVRAEAVGCGFVISGTAVSPYDDFDYIIYWPANVQFAAGLYDGQQICFTQEAQGPFDPDEDLTDEEETACRVILQEIAAAKPSCGS